MGPFSTTRVAEVVQAGPPLTIEESATLAGAWAWAETSLYEVVGGWARSTTRPSTKVYFDACSQHHAWRAQLWQERLPARLVATRSGASDLLKPLSDGAAQVMKALSCVEGDVGRLAGYCRVVLPRTVVAYRAWQRRCTDASDRPVARALGFATDDALADWERGSALLVDLLDNASAADAVDRSAEATREVERVLVDEGSDARG
ncbi:MAG TPA: hypothetical protein VN786_09900 [Acidimicrobiales bacterium]|nr:hypothetical protein [Acidimicrobiales bacterium]